MIYIFSFFSSVMLLGFAFGVYVVIKHGNNLGYVNYFVGGYTFISFLFIPLFYGSVGSFFSWPNHRYVYEHSWVPVVVGPVVGVLVLYILDRALKRNS